MRAYFGSKLSDNITTTPEGFLICLNVPIGRTGKQEYLRSELELEDGDPNEVVNVYRDAAEVFAPATIASFEGKPVTSPHPPVEVNPENIMAYACGHMQNVRRGTGDERDLLLADLFITAPNLIEAIQKGSMREVSCGYTCNYAPDEHGHYHQSSIRGNHVAVVSAGRAGSRVAIKDSAESKQSLKEAKTTMSKPTKSPSLFARMFGIAVKDMQPDEIADAIDELQQTPANTDTAPEPSTPTDNAPVPTTAEKPTGDDTLAAILEALQALTSKIDALAIRHDSEPTPEQKDTDPLDALVAEIAKESPQTPADQEESVTIPADEMPDNTTDEEGPVAAANTLPENPIPGADSRAALMAISSIKPIIAKLPADQRKVASDTAVAQIRSMMGQSARPKTNGYSAINGMMRENAITKAKDAKPAKDESEVGKAIMASRNPHYKAKA